MLIGPARIPNEHHGRDDRAPRRCPNAQPRARRSLITSTFENDLVNAGGTSPRCTGHVGFAQDQDPRVATQPHGNCPPVIHDGLLHNLALGFQTRHSATAARGGIAVVGERFDVPHGQHAPPL